jgi:hypothetical protein
VINAVCRPLFPLTSGVQTRMLIVLQGQKKLKCDGGYPTCGRCSTISESCIYSARLPMGRPKKRKVISESEQHDSSAASRTSPSTLAMSMDSDNGSDRGRRASFDTCQHMSEDTPMDMLSFG